MASADNKIEAHMGDRVCRVSGSCKIWIIVLGATVSLFALLFAIIALKPLFLPCGHGQLTFSNECEIAVEKAVVSFGKNTVELNGIPPRGESTEHFFVRDDCSCRVVATLADGFVISNSYGYYCYGMDCGTVTVTLTNDKHGIKFVCKDSVAAKTGPEKPKPDAPLIPYPGVGTTTTAWDALTNVCNSVGCRFEVYSGKVEMGK